MATFPPKDFSKLFPNYNDLGAQLESLMKLRRSDAPTTFPSNAPNSSSPQPKSLEEIDAMYKQGSITKEQADQMELNLSNPTQPQEINDSMINPDGSLITTRDQRNSYRQQGSNMLPALNFAGSDLTTELFSLGANIGSPQGTQGRTAGIIGSAGAATFNIARDIFAGIGYQKASNYAQQYQDEQSQKQNYTPNQQYQNDNYTGGLPTGKYGGLFQYQNGGPVMPDPTELEKLRQLDTEYSRQNGTTFGLEGSTLLIDPQQLAAFEQQYGSSLQGKRVWVNPQGGSFVVDANPQSTTGTPPPPPAQRTIPNEGPITGTKKFVITGDGTGIGDQKTKTTSVNVPYASREELDAIERQMRTIKSYADYKKSELYQKYGDKLLGSGSQNTGGFREGGVFGKQIGDKITFKHGGVMKSGVIKKIDLETGKFYI